MVRKCNIKKTIISGLFYACDQPGPGSITPGEKGTLELELSFYPGDEVIYNETYSLFCTDVFIPSYDSTITSYSLVFYYDNSILEYESVYNEQSIFSVCESPGSITIRTIDTHIPPGEYLRLCTLTWKARLTGITKVSVEAGYIIDDLDRFMVALGSAAGIVKIEKELGTLFFKGNKNIKEGNDFYNTLYINSEDAIIKEYALDILYDPEKITPDTTIGNNGIITGTDGFIDCVSPGDGVISIKGISKTGTGPGTDLEFFIMNWHAIDSGRVNLRADVYKIVTADNVYIKPTTWSFSFSVYTETKPVIDVWIEPAGLEVGLNDSFVTSIFLNTEGYVLAAYGINIFYDPDILELDRSQANGIEAGSDGFLAAANSNNPGVIRTTGFEISGVPPDSRLELLKVYWKAKNITASTDIELVVNTLADVRSLNIDWIGVPEGCTVTVTE